MSWMNIEASVRRFNIQFGAVFTIALGEIFKVLYWNICLRYNTNTNICSFCWGDKVLIFR